MNGEPQQSSTRMTVQELLEQHQLLQRRVAVAINAAVISRSRYGEVQIRDGDKIEVLHAVGGG
jgi:thiamine biosynthesis protein ThiS